MFSFYHREWEWKEREEMVKRRPAAIATHHQQQQKTTTPASAHIRVSNVKQTRNQNKKEQEKINKYETKHIKKKNEKAGIKCEDYYFCFRLVLRFSATA